MTPSKETGRTFSVDRNVLKIIAILSMLFDHVGLFFTEYTPYYFRILGRVAAPIFTFLLVDGFLYSSNRRKYFLRLYGLNVLMIILNLWLGLDLKMNYIHTLLATFIILYLIELFPKRYYQKAIFLFISAQIVLLVISIILMSQNDAEVFVWCINSLFLGLAMTEGGIICVLMGVLFYFTRDKKSVRCICYVFFLSGSIFLENTPIMFLLLRNLRFSHIYATVWEVIFGTYPLDLGHLSMASFFESSQWMELLLVPLFFMYRRDGERNHSKYNMLLYFIYPVHICILSILKSFLYHW